jgi:hypothetical protein
MTTKTAKPAAEPATPGKPTTKASSATGDGRTIKLLAKTNPSKKGTKRYERWQKLKTGMTVAEAVAAGVPSTYLNRMAALGHLSIG